MDISTAKGFGLLMTRNRVKTNLPRFFAAAQATGMTIPGYVVVDTDDYAQNQEAYDALVMPVNWTIHVVQGGNLASASQEALNELLSNDTDYVFWMGDDLVPETPGWDAAVVSSLTGWNVVSTDDGLTAPKRLGGATAWSGDLLRAVGYLYPPGIKHYYIDDIWEDLGRTMNVWTLRMDILVRHLHPTKNPALFDATYARTAPFSADDERHFGIWKNKERLPAANRIGELLIGYGVAQAQPDLSDVRLLITTPSGDGKYEALFMSSLIGSIALLRQCGAQVNFSEMKYCSDITLARTKILGSFVRSDATHMMCIDADMGWNPQDIVRLIMHKKDYVAVAGPRKVFPESFAVQNSDERGRPKPLRQEATGLFEVSHVGLAFALVTRAWAERLTGAYPELEWAGDDGRVEYAVFNPMVMNRRYFSEDYAACERWRAIGGTVYVDPYISLQHVGTYVWQGAWMNQLISSAAGQAAVA